MTQLVKATLCEISGDDRGTEVETPIDVQFNPTSLRVQIQNKTAGGQQAGSQARQRPGTGEISVSFDLIFDTADEGTTEQPVPVTRKTMIVEKFVRPRGSAPNQQTPPRVQFKWGTFLVQGVMESANLELDLFSSNGTPLRAKVSVSIKGQDPQYRYDPLLPAAAAGAGNSGGPPPSPLDPPRGQPGTTGTTENPSQVAQAMPGESLQQLAARNGLDPSAWRALAEGIGNPLSLPAGFEISLPSSLRLGGEGLSGRGSRGNDAQQATRTLPLVSGKDLPVQPDSGPVQAGGSAVLRNDGVKTGQAVAQQGGLSGAIGKVKGDAQQQAVQGSRQAFALAHAPGEDDALIRPFGLGVPLRPLRGDADEQLRYSADPTRPGWEALPLKPAPGARPLNRLKPRDPCRCDCGPSVRSANTLKKFRR